MSQNIRDQIKDLDIEVAPSYPPKEYSRFDDFTRVTDLRRGQDLLYIGANAYFPSVKRNVRTITTAKNKRELEKLLSAERVFDRIFIARENVLDERLVTAAVQLIAPRGLVCFFSEDEGLRAGFNEIVEKNYPTAQTWTCKSNVGPLVMTDAKGNPSYQD
jgi:hypothetical protein